MKKIMFNDKYGLTQVVLDCRKTITRRVVPEELLECITWYAQGDKAELTYRLIANSTYKVGEVVAIAQSYESILCDLFISDIIRNEISDNHPGYKNKMFVKTELMPHHIKITNVRIEHLQDISDEDCLREGIYEKKLEYTPSGYKPNRTYYTFDGVGYCFNDARDAFAALIDKVSGKGTWDSNPLVWVYEFELVDLVNTK